MSTTVIWIVPCHYNTQEQDLVFDMTDHAKTIFKNQVWKRGCFRNSFSFVLNELDIESIKKFEIIISPYYHEAGVNDNTFKRGIIQKYSLNVSQEFADSFMEANLNSSKNLLIAKAEFNFEIENPQKADISRDYFVKSQQIFSVFEEVMNLFRVTALLHFKEPDEIIIYQDTKDLSGGIIEITAPQIQTMRIRKSKEFTYPIIFLNDDVEEFKKYIEKITTLWHLNLWSLHRFAKALSSSEFEIENLLNILYSFEGVFSKNSSSDFMRLSTSILLSESKKEALEIIDILKVSFRLRNNVVHGAVFLNEYENIKIGGVEKTAIHLFYELRKIVTRILKLSIDKLLNENMKNLKINNNDIFEKVLQ